MASNQSKVAESRPKTAEVESTPEQTRPPSPPLTVPVEARITLIDSGDGGKPDLDTGQADEKGGTESKVEDPPDTKTVDQTSEVASSQVCVTAPDLTPKSGVTSSEGATAPQPVANILTDLEKTVTTDKTQIQTAPQKSDRMSTEVVATMECIPSPSEVKSQETESKLVELKSQNIPKPIEDKPQIPDVVVEKSQDIPNIVEEKTQELPPKTSEISQDIELKSSEVKAKDPTETQEPLVTTETPQKEVPTEMETSESVLKPTELTPKEPDVAPIEEPTLKQIEIATEKPVGMETQDPNSEPVVTEAAKDPVQMETQTPVEITPPDTTQTSELEKQEIPKPTEMEQESHSKPVEMETQESDSKPIEIVTLDPVQTTPQGLVPTPNEMIQELVSKPVEMTAQDLAPVETATQEPIKKLIETTTMESTQTQNSVESKTLPISEETGTTIEKQIEISVPVQPNEASEKQITMAEQATKESTIETSQIIHSAADISQESASLPSVASVPPPIQEVITPSGSLPDNKTEIADVIILDEDSPKVADVATHSNVVFVDMSEKVVIQVETPVPIQSQPETAGADHLNDVLLKLTEVQTIKPETTATSSSQEEPLSSEEMQIDPTPCPPPVDTDLMDVGQKGTDPPTITSLPVSMPIDTIVISDSPASTVSYSTQSAEQMDVIVLTSESSPEHFSPLSTTTPPSKRSKVSLSDTASPPPIPIPTGSKSKLSADLELLELLINSCEMLVGLSIQDQNVCFSYQYKDVCDRYTFICIEGDYPQVSLYVSSKDGNYSDILSKRLPCVAWDLLLHSCEKQGLPPPSTDSLPLELRDLLQPAFQTQVSSQSNASHATTGTDDDQDYTDDSGDEDPYDEFEEPDEVTMHQLLIEDIERVKQKFNPNAIVTRNYGGIGDIDIDLIIDMNFLEPEIARAWGVKHTIPLTVRLSLSADHYLDGGDIKTEVFQEDRANTKGICKQMEKIISQFISTNTKAMKNPLCNSKVEEAVEAHRNLEQRLVEKRRILSKLGPASEKKGVIAQFMGKFSREKQVDCDLMIAQLVEMGWETEMAVHALQECNMDLEKALDYLSNERVDESDEDVNPKTFSKQQSRGAEVSGLDWMSDLSDSNEAANKSKIPPSLSHGFLCHVIQYILNRIPTLNDFCVICDETHLFSNGAMLKPTVCARELCSFAFQTLGVMADVADSIATGPEVVELLVAMCNAACLSSRREDILDPYPTVVDPNNPKQFALHSKDKDFKKVEKAMGFVVQELKSLPAVLKERLDSLNVTAFPLLQWVLASNRCHIVKLPPDRQIKSMGTTHQFLLLSAPPAKEAAFRKLKLKHKSTYAFHGSRLENWHSIMRNGLLNASGTKFQLNGAAYGSGIYLSPHASVSFGYSGIHGCGGPAVSAAKKGRPTMLSSQNLNCIALCEVIDVKIKKSGNIWVLPESEHVVTRFFFVYEDNTSGDTNFDTRQDKYIKEIENAVKSLL